MEPTNSKVVSVFIAYINNGNKTLKGFITGQAINEDNSVKASVLISYI